MKTTDSRDPLDQEIDRLLNERPVKAEPAFLQNVLEAVDRLDATDAPSPQIHWGRRITAIATPIAAAIALAFILSPSSDTTTSTQQASNLNLIEAQEIFDLSTETTELSLASDFSSIDFNLLATFDAIYFEIES